MSYLTQKLWNNDRNMAPASLPGMTSHIETKHTYIGAPTLTSQVNEDRLPGRWSYATALWCDDPFWEPQLEEDIVPDTDPGYKESPVVFSTDWSTESSQYDILA